MTQQKTFIGSVGPKLYDDSDDYRSGGRVRGIKTTRTIATEDRVIIGLTNPGVYDSRFVSLSSSTGTNIYPDADLNYPLGRIEAFAFDNANSDVAYARYFLGGDGNVSLLEQTGGIFDSPNTSGKAHINSGGGGSEYFITNDYSSDLQFVLNSLLTPTIGNSQTPIDKI